MNTPFTLELQLEEVNVREDTPHLDRETYPVRVTLRHTVADVYQSIWCNSDNFSLKPVFLHINDSNGEPVSGTFHELLNIEEPPTEPVRDFKLKIDYFLFNNRCIPVQDPIEDLFDVVIEWNDTRGNTNNIRIRESLKCTVGTLKAYVADERNKTVAAEDFVDGNYFNLRYWRESEPADNDTTIADVVQLDVPPLAPVLFELSYNLEYIEEQERIAAEQQRVEEERVQAQAAQEAEEERQRQPPEPTRRRFFIKVSSSVPNLQEESSLFEVDDSTTLRTFINTIIDRADMYQVRRTFFNQVKLNYNGESITDTEEFDTALFDVLGLNDETLASNRNVLTMGLTIHQHLSGVEGGMLSRQFLDDLTSTTRFEFLPTTRDDLAREEHEFPPSPQVEQQPVTEEEEEVVRIGTTRVVLASGEEWGLTGDTFDVLETNAMSVGPSQPTRSLVVNQDDLLPNRFQFSVTLPGQSEPTEVYLNTNQCIVVDNGQHRPYLLLNESGMARLVNTFKDQDGQTLLQQVQINLYDPPPVQDQRPPVAAHEAPTGGVPPQLRADGDNNMGAAIRGNQGPFARIPGFTALSILFSITTFLVQSIRHHGSLIFQAILIIFLFDFWTIPFEVWYNTVCIVFIFVAAFKTQLLVRLLERRVVVANVERVGVRGPRTLRGVTLSLKQWDESRSRLFRSLRVRIVKFAVVRPRDYEYLVMRLRHDGRREVLKHTLKNAVKDVVLHFITVIPSTTDILEVELEHYRETETADLKGDIHKTYDEFVRAKAQYLQKTGTEFPGEFDISLVDSYVTGERGDNGAGQPVEQGNQAGEQLNQEQEQADQGPAQEPDAMAEPETEAQTEIEAGSGESQPADIFTEQEMEYQIMLTQYLKLYDMHQRCLEAL